MSTIAAPRIVLDTNVLVGSLGRSSPSRWVREAIEAERIRLVVSTEVLLEYEETLGRRMPALAAAQLLDLLLTVPHVQRVEPHFRWRRVPADPDDDKFVDLAIAAGADALVSEDRHFDALALAAAYPPVRVLRLDAFQRWLAA